VELKGEKVLPIVLYGKSQIYTNRKWSTLWGKTIIAAMIVLTLFCGESAGGGEEGPLIKAWTSSNEYSVKVEMSVPRLHKMVYQILIDYESIEKHIDLVKVSRLLEREENIVHIYQLYGMKVLFF
jgi:hypothetical protein